MQRKEDTLKITLKAARVNAGLTQKEVAEKLKISNQTVVNWEKGKNVPRMPELYALSQIYGVSVDNIFLP